MWRLCLVLLLASQVQAADNLVILLDTSGSMSETMSGSRDSRMTVAQQSLWKLSAQIPPQTKVGLLTFQGWVYPFGEYDEQRLSPAILNTSPGGSTPLGQYVKIGADILLEQRNKEHGLGTYRLLIVTDGEANDAQVLDGHVREILGRGLSVTTIGLDLRKDHSLSKITKYVPANNPAALETALVTAVAEVGASGGDALSEESFALLEGFPQDVSQEVIKSITDYKNQPVGELPLIRVVDENGNVTWVQPPKEPSSSGIMIWVVIVIGVLVMVCGLAIILH